MSNFYCHPGIAGGFPNVGLKQRFLAGATLLFPDERPVTNLQHRLNPAATFSNYPVAHPIHRIFIMKTLQDILNQRNLSALFQPIMDLSNGTFLGFEGLIRGPADSPLHSPINLFAAAKQQGLSLEVEMLCRQIVLESFAAQNLPGNLFLNISPDALAHPSLKEGKTLT